MAVALHSNAEIFAANRATGHIALSVAASGGRTRRTHVHEDGSLRVRFPKSASDALEAVIVNTGGGMTGGDRFAVEIALGDGAKPDRRHRGGGKDLSLDRARRRNGRRARRSARARQLAWLPQETILFDRARLARRIDVDLSERASLLMAEPVVFGRAAMGEAMAQGFFADRWRVRRAGKLIFAEGVRLDGAVSARLAAPAAAAGGIAIASVLVAPADDGKLAAVRALADQFVGEVGISAWNGIAVARLCARMARALRHDLIAMLAALGQPVPRLWLELRTR